MSGEDLVRQVMLGGHWMRRVDVARATMLRDSDLDRAMGHWMTRGMIEVGHDGSAVAYRWIGEQ